MNNINLGKSDQGEGEIGKTERTSEKFRATHLTRLKVSLPAGRMTE